MTTFRARRACGASSASTYEGRGKKGSRAGETHTFVLPPAPRSRFEALAVAAYPRECCGLIEGVRRGEVIKSLRLHPTQNLAARSDRFEIDAAEHIRLLRTLRGSGSGIVGCYHSHPDGVAAPSAHDRSAAIDDGLVWLIAAVGRIGPVHIAAHLFVGGEFRLLRIAPEGIAVA